MRLSHSIIRIAAAGLPPDTIDEIHGELTRFEDPHRSGSPFSDRELIPVVLWEAVRARCNPRNWSHLPTVVPVAFAMMAAGSAVLAMHGMRGTEAMASAARTYIPVLLADLVTALVFAARSVPVKRVAAASGLLAAAVIFQISSISRATPLEVLLDRAGAAAAMLAPVAWVALAVRYRDRHLGWDELPAAITTSRVTGWAWWGMTAVALSFGIRNLAFLPAQSLPPVLVSATLVNIVGLVLAGLAFAAAGRRPAAA